MRSKKLFFCLAVTAILSGCGDSDSGGGVSFQESEGKLDTAFMEAFGSGPSSSVDAMIVLQDGGILLGGRFSTVSGKNHSYLYKVTSSGSADTTFNSNLGSGPNDAVYALYQMDDGSILVGGDFTSFNGTNFGRLAKLSSAGVVDYTFSSAGTGFNGKVSAIASIGSTGIVVGGGFSSYKGVSIGKIAKLSSSGALDSTFDSNSGSGFNLEVNTLYVDGSSIYVGGSFESYNGTASRRLAKLSNTGVLNSTFQTNFGADGFNSGVLKIFRYNSDSLLVGGQFSTFDSDSYSRIIGLSTIGKLSDSLNTALGSGFTNSVYTLADQSNGAILIGGDFSSYKLQNAPGLIRLKSDLSIDTAFLDNLGDGFDGTVRVVQVQDDGKILVGGDFNSFGTNDSPYLIRLK